LQQNVDVLPVIDRAIASFDLCTVTAMLKIFALLLLLMGALSVPSVARTSYDPTPDCEPVRINGEWDCATSGPFITSRQITWFFMVVLVPIGLFVTLRGAIKESRMSDEEWQRRYPGRELWTRDRRPLGIGFYLGSAYLIAGVGFFWLLFVAPETLKWLIGQ
jgi:hypothetical protein